MPKYLNYDCRLWFSEFKYTQSCRLEVICSQKKESTYKKGSSVLYILSNVLIRHIYIIMTK